MSMKTVVQPLLRRLWLALAVGALLLGGTAALQRHFLADGASDTATALPDPLAEGHEGGFGGG